MDGRGRIRTFIGDCLADLHALCHRRRRGRRGRAPPTMSLSSSSPSSLSVLGDGSQDAGPDQQQQGTKTVHQPNTLAASC